MLDEIAVEIAEVQLAPPPADASLVDQLRHALRNHIAYIVQHADDQRPRLAPGTREHRSAVAGSQVDDDPFGASDQGFELADIHLVDAPADDASHGRESTLPRCHRRRVRRRVRSVRTSAVRPPSDRGIRTPSRLPSG